MGEFQSPGEDEVKNGQDQAADRQDIIRRAQEVTRADGIEVGDMVAHPSDSYIYRIAEIKGQEATCVLSAERNPDHVDVIRHFPVNELFSPEAARTIAMLKRNPESSAGSGAKEI